METKTILVVEDDESIRELAVMILKQHGFHTLEAPDGRIGLAAFLRRRGEIDLVLSDLVMPHSGVEMAEQILRAAPSARIIFMSGTAGITDFPVHLKRFPMLHKPFTSGALVQAVRDALAR